MNQAPRCKLALHATVCDPPEVKPSSPRLHAQVAHRGTEKIPKIHLTFPKVTHCGFQQAAVSSSGNVRRRRERSGQTQKFHVARSRLTSRQGKKKKKKTGEFHGGAPIVRHRCRIPPLPAFRPGTTASVRFCDGTCVRQSGVGKGRRAPGAQTGPLLVTVRSGRMLGYYTIGLACLQIPLGLGEAGELACVCRIQ